MIRNIAVALSLVFLLVTLTDADETREVFEKEVTASLDDVWTAFTTTQGLQSWVAPLADIDFKVGGKWRANYDPKGKLGDSKTIENTILAYDPKRMIALKATKFPAGFPFVDAAKEAWSIFYFERVSATRTKITVVGLGYSDSEQSRKMRAFFKTANKHSIEQLEAALTRSEKKKDAE